LTLPQSHPRPTAVVIDELDAGRFQRTANGQIISCCHGSVTFGKFGTPNRAQAYG
jgi:hypothetical protein